jgi:hypothetical protein
MRSRTGHHLLLTTSELAFYKVLREAIADRWELSLKTRLADVVGCPPALWKRPFGRRIAQKHVDFVLYDPANGAIRAVVELDDPTHIRPERRKRDRFVNHLLEREAIPLVRVHVRRHYDVTQLRRRLDSAIIASAVDQGCVQSTLTADASLDRRDDD